LNRLNLQADVREPAELQEGKIPNAINLPLSSLKETLSLPESVFHQKFDFEKPDKNRVRTSNESELTFFFVGSDLLLQSWTFADVELGTTRAASMIGLQGSPP